MLRRGAGVAAANIAFAAAAAEAAAALAAEAVAVAAAAAARPARLREPHEEGADELVGHLVEHREVWHIHHVPEGLVRLAKVARNVREEQHGKLPRRTRDGFRRVARTVCTTRNAPCTTPQEPRHSTPRLAISRRRPLPHASTLLPPAAARFRPLPPRCRLTCLSDQPAHFCADGELKASSSAAETTPASPIRLRIVCAITGESFTCGRTTERADRR